VPEREPVRVDELVDTELDRVSIEHLDFTPVCSVRMRRLTVLVANGESVPNGPMIHDCGVTAVANMLCRACRHSVAICADHRAQVEATAMIVCGACKKTGRTAVLITFIPLGGVA
jgi:hypothetical protein